MRLVHISDLHLGFRQYQRLTPAGINQREADVAASFRRVIDKVIELRPDIVVVAGDVFHNVRPTNPAILHAFAQLSRLRQALPDTIVVVIAGNHDTPRSSETGCILRLFVQLGVEVVDDAPRRLSFRSTVYRFWPFPTCPARPAQPSCPSRASATNVLLLHGEIEGSCRQRQRRPIAHRSRSRRRSLGRRDGATSRSATTTCTANCGERVLLRIARLHERQVWGELHEERAARLPARDSSSTTARRAPTIPSGAAEPRLVDLSAHLRRRPIRRRFDAAIRAAVDACPGGIDDKIVRLVLRDVPRHVTRELNHKAIRDYRRRALHFLLDPRKPHITRNVGQGAPGRRPSLADTLREKLSARAIEADIDRERLVSLGLYYLSLAEVITAEPITPTPSRWRPNEAQPAPADELPQHIGTAIEFDSGLTGIIGPNGSGKSTVLEQSRGRCTACRRRAALGIDPVHPGARPFGRSGGAGLRPWRSPLPSSGPDDAELISTDPRRRSRTRSPASPSSCGGGSA